MNAERDDIARYDIAIAGGGMVGASLALALADKLADSSRIVLLEGFPLPARNEDYQANYSPSFDARSTALSYSSRTIYQGMGVWNELSRRACPIDSIHVSERGRFGSTLMRAADYQWDALGYVVENAWLGNVLLQCLHRQQRVELRSPARVVAAAAGADAVRLKLEDAGELHTRLLVVADGAESSLRRALGIDVQQHVYGQHALIANIAHALEHQGCAYERFTEQGPLAFLPLLPTTDGVQRSALVWTVSEQEAAHFTTCPEQELLCTLQQRFGYRLGRMRQAGTRHSYPLSLVQAEEQVRPGIVLLGNAAHSLHPVAGQGFNLALRDVAALAQLIANAQRNGEDFASLAELQRYQQQQHSDQQRTVAFSDYLPGLFMQRDPGLSMLRDFGLFALDISPALKREFVRHTAGIAALSGQANG